MGDVPICREWPLRATGWYIILTALFMTISCSLPSVRVFEDALTAEEHLTLGVAYEKRGEFENAVEQYEQAREAGETHADLYLGNAWFGRGDLRRAEGHFRAALRSDPECHEAMNNLAWLIAQQGGDLSEAEALARQALVIANRSGDDSVTSEYRNTLETIRDRKSGK